MIFSEQSSKNKYALSRELEQLNYDNFSFNKSELVGTKANLSKEYSTFNTLESTAVRSDYVFAWDRGCLPSGIFEDFRQSSSLLMVKPPFGAFTSSECSSTYNDTQSKVNDEMVRSVEISINNARYLDDSEDLSDKMQEAITLLINDYGGEVLTEFERQLVSESTNSIKEAILISFGRIFDAATHNRRRQILLRQLDSQKVFNRETALTGLSYMHDKQTLKYIKRASSLETVNIIKLHFKRVIEDFEN